MAKTAKQTLAKKQKELSSLEKRQNKNWGRYYYGYLVALLSIIYIIDEVATSIGGTVQSSIVTEFFVEGRGTDYNTGLATFGTITTAFMLISLFAPFYKALSDRFGRKLFLAINTIGMGVGLLVSYTSQSLIQYLIGFGITYFFIAHDMQTVYIMETAPPKWRGTTYAAIKCIASVGIVLIPVLRSLTMGNDPTKWRAIFMVPGILGLAFGVLVMFTAKESPSFLKHRIAHLKETEEQRQVSGEAEKKKKAEDKGGVGRAFKFMFRHKQLRWLSITNLIFFGAIAATSYYESIMSKGGMTTEQVTQALFVFPFVNAGLTLLNGLLADRIGRKNTALTMGLVSLASFVLFVTGISFGWSPYFIGACYGGYFGGFWSAGDILGGIMCGESAPTRLRASVMAAQSLLMLISTVISVVILMVSMLFVDNLGILCLCLIAPFVLIGLVVLKTKVGDTKGLDLNTVTGEEWD